MTVSDEAPGGGSEVDSAAERRRELSVFLFTTLILIPGAAVAVVGGYGLIVWILQMIFGPPGPPA